MHTPAPFHTWYDGSPAEKLSQAQTLFDRLGREGLIDALLTGEIDLLRADCQRLAAQMEVMALGRLCSRCATQPGGGCCSAYMAGNTDSLLILINLLLEIKIHQRQPPDADCCFVGPSGCLFMAKPIFCLNYNCSHIQNGTDSATLACLEQYAAAVLSRQTRIETLLLDRLRTLTF
jgi:hypothetical protein